MKLKKYLIILIIITSVYSSRVSALEKVELVNCTSISNIWVTSNGTNKRIHINGIDTPVGELDEEINTYICTTLKNASILEIEYESNEKDKYNRDLVKIYADKKSLQEDLIEKGYAYIDNIATSYLCNVEKQAIINKKGIWTYPNIEEPYCKNNISSATNETNDKKEESKKKIYDIKYMILINCGILLLLVLIRSNYGKR